MKKKTQVRKRARRNQDSHEEWSPQSATNSKDLPTKQGEQISENQKSEDAETSIDDAKLQTMFLLQIQGKTQTQCAEFFGVTDRTIRNWNKKLEEITPKLLQDINPGTEALAVLFRFMVRETKLLKWEQEAEETGDSKTNISCNKELRRLDQERRAFFEQIGLFSKLQINFSVTRDPTEEAAILVQTSFLKVLQAGFPPDDPRVDRGKV